MKNLNKLFLILLTVLFTSGVIFAQTAQKNRGVKSDLQPQTMTKSDALIPMASNTEIDFEEEVEFTFDFSPWTVADVDGLPTYGFTGIDFPNSYAEMAYIVFDPANTVPPMTDDLEIQPHSGEQFGACFASVPSGSIGNDDWFITPQLGLEDGASFTFWAKSYTGDYGLEVFNVAVSTSTNDPADFSVISGGTPVEAPLAWTEFSYDLSAYAGQDVYIAIQCVSFDAFVFMIDDLVVATGGSGPSSALYEDSFESYTTGGYIAEQNPEWWATWSGTPGGGEDGMISEDVAMTGSKSVLIDDAVSASDLIWKLGDKVSGAYNVNFYMYIPEGYCGYYNFQHMESPGVEWAIEMYFHTDGTCMFNIAGEVLEDYTYVHDTWIYFEHMINLDDDLAQISIDGEFYKEWQWSLQAQGAAGANQLGGIDFFAGADAAFPSDIPKYYLDDVNYSVAVTALYEDNFESYTTGGYIAEQNPEWWSTWSGTPGGGEDGMISEDVAMSGSKSVLVDDAVSATDLLLLLGDKVSGAFDVNFYMYVPDGYSAYYNFQHMESPGVEWANEMYFHTDGTCMFNIAGEVLEDYTYLHDTWIYFEQKIDLDNDIAQLHINGEFYKEWQWSLQAQGAAGANQLGGIDFYAGADAAFPSDVPKYYIDDVMYSQTAFETDPIITLEPFMFEQTLNQGQTASQTLTVGNIGATDLDFEIAVIYDVGDERTPIIPSETPSNHVLDLSCSAVATANSQSPTATDDEVTLNYDTDNTSSIGWTTAPTDAEVAAMYPASMTGPYAGMQLTSVFIFINDLGENFKLKVYGMGTDIAPGSLLVEQDFSPTAANWTLIELDEPLTINGGDLWVGYSFTQQAEDMHIPGTDAGPNDPNGDWLKTGVGWGHLSSNPDLPYNWNIRANLVGEPIVHWLTVDPATGMVVPAGTEDVSVNFDATGVEAGTHVADIVVFSNDPENRISYIPVTLTVEGGAAQTIDIAPGFQFVSSYINPETPDMTEVVAEIMNDDLQYVRNSIGAMLRKIGPNWVNGIGDWVGTEGYLIKTSAIGEFTIAGEQIGVSTPIPLTAGFQFVSYLPETEIDALEAFATIIGDDLLYVRNSIGAMLRKIGPNWVNGIGNGVPTEGYLIKMAADADLVYPSAGAPASVASVEKSVGHFVFEGGDPSANLWTIYIGGAEISYDADALEAGDEIAVFDGELIVGVVTLTQVCTPENQFENFLVAFTELVSGPGYVDGNAFKFVAWDESEGSESIDFSYIFDDPYGDAWTGDTFPIDVDAPYSMATFSFTGVGIDENSVNVAIYPNPATDVLTINSDSKISSVKVLNYLGQTIDNINVSGMDVTINTSTYDAGIYFMQIETEKGISTQKIIIE